ncbi:hypothetical protein SDC9_92932 [bioreactor metagenome]|uniref:Uncharacterized protein n=1 Tax=bioreactor metagenome TaxID=1076179 RepID=A0A645A917_9ZZZZ
MGNQIAFASSIATLLLFCIYFIGRIITILSVKKIWRDKVILGINDYSQYEIVDIVGDEVSAEPRIVGILLSREGMRNVTVYSVVADTDGLLTQKGKTIYTNEFLNIDQAIAFSIETGDLFPSLFIEYTSLDYMKIRMEWRDNLKNGVYSELVWPAHTVRSFLYYLFR